MCPGDISGAGKRSLDDEEEDTGSDKDEHDITESKDEGSFKGFAFLNEDVHCSIQEMPGAPGGWILLDSQSTVDVFLQPKAIDQHQRCEMNTQSRFQ